MTVLFSFAEFAHFSPVLRVLYDNRFALAMTEIFLTARDSNEIKNTFICFSFFFLLFLYVCVCSNALFMMRWPSHRLIKVSEWPTSYESAVQRAPEIDLNKLRAQSEKQQMKRRDLWYSRLAIFGMTMFSLDWRSSVLQQLHCSYDISARKKKHGKNVSWWK